MNIFSKICIALFVSSANSLQFLLNTADPVCIQVTPSSHDMGMTVSYSITGVNEDQVTFTATQQKQVVNEVVGERDKTLVIDTRGKAPVELCWSKADRKAKKVNFLIIQPTKDLNQKATMQTIDDLSDQIQGL